MSSQVKVSPLAQEVSSAPITQLANDNVLTLTQSSNVAINIDPDAVQGYSKSGADLLIKLDSGETIRIVNFYAPGQEPSQLFLVDDDKLVAVYLPPVAADGALAAQYIPQETLAGFESLTTASEEGITAGMAWLIGAGVVGAGAAIASGGGGGGGGHDPQPNPGEEPDVTAPAPASDLQVAPDGSSIGGKAEPGASVGVDTNGDGKPDVSVIAGPDGSFNLPLQPPLTNGETITVIVTDPSGNSSPPAQIDAPDSTAPAPASNLQVAPDGSSVSGNAEPGATVGIDTNGDGEPDQTVVVGGDGSFTAPLQPPLTNGETITVIVTDPTGNNSPPAQVGAPDSTAPAPASNLQVAPDGSSVSGNAEPGATVGIDTNGDGEPDQTVVAGTDGSFTAPLQPPLTNGETITVIVTDPTGNNSPPAQVGAPDSTAPAPASNLQVAPDGSSVSGNAEPGATVGIDTNGDGEPDQTVVAGTDGSFTAPLQPPLTNGETVTVIVTDPTGNSSTPAQIDAPDSTAPAPASNLQVAADGSSLSGTAEAGATVLIDLNGDGTVDTTALVAADGSFTVALTPPLHDGETISVVVRDPAGNGSSAATVLAPDFPNAPLVNPSNGASVSGTAEAGVGVVVRDASGNLIGQTTADGTGAWSITPAVPVADGVTLNVQAVDVNGNPSPTVSVVVDAIAPPAPVIAPSNGEAISGSAEAGATITLTDAGGTVLGEVT
ncbi:Ig-like domain-containing protein, partial [Pseudomonas sp. 5P_3.1_Bac2]|uniref:Ig-like domain-containing protein n=1 Tax=Pseudomonas sp. 5P_3.1_Bac2 TaxID=2971617 RepID=UPI0021C66272